MTIRFVIPGEPVAKGRPRMTRTGHAYTPSKTRLYEGYIQDLWKRSRFAELPTGQPIRVCVDAYFSVPKSVSKKRRSAMEGAPHIKKPDADNVVKAVLDALNGLAFEDDSRICYLKATKQYTLGEPRVEITLECSGSYQGGNDYEKAQL